MYYQEFKFFVDGRMIRCELYLCIIAFFNEIMKISKTYLITFSFFLLLAITNTLKAQETKAEITIKSSVVCDMCKKKVEKVLTFKGIEKSSVDLQTKMITVTYDPQQTNPEKIKTAIANAGYDADEIKANPKAYKRLDKCCKKENEHL